LDFSLRPHVEAGSVCMWFRILVQSVLGHLLAYGYKTDKYIPLAPSPEYPPPPRDTMIKHDRKIIYYCY